MKILKLTAIASLILIFNTGCSIDSKSPEELIKEKPIYNEKKEELYKAIEQELTLNSLILPSNSSEVGKINEVDLDSDGVDEIIAFEKKEIKANSENESEVGFMILSKNKNERYTYTDNLLEKGESIEYGNFYDLNQDGIKEIILLIKEGDKEKYKGKTNLHIYSYKDNEINKIYTLNPGWIEDKENLSDMKIKIGHMNDDNIVDILFMNYNLKTNKAYLSLAEFEKRLIIRDFIEFENIKSVSDSYITIGNIDKDKIGIILDMPTIKDNNYMTQMLYIEDNDLIKVFSDYDKSIMKPYYIPVQDINNDKIIDIPIVNGSGAIYTVKNSTIISWYKWNGKSKENSRLVFSCQVYYNYQYNYKLMIPEILENKLDIKEEFSDGNPLFKFYYYDTVKNKPIDLFTISLANKKILDESKSVGPQSTIILNESTENVFILYINNENEMKKLNLSADSIREFFSLIY
ncbi:MAG: hypothetical protein RR942_11440 [Romboutsia sp.]